MKNTIYIVKYTYYQYNSGMGDNGTYSKKIEFEHVEDAKLLYKNIQDCIDKKLDEQSEHDLINDYLNYDGYFKEVKIYKAIVEEYDIDSNTN